MTKKVWTVLAALMAASIATSAHAIPIDFSTAQYDTSAFAISGTAADANSDATPSPLPLISTALVTPANDFATANALAASGLLVASSEADSFTGASGASAGAQSHFVSTIFGSGRLVLHFDFDSLDALGGGDGSGTVFVLLTNTLGPTTTTLFNGFFDTSIDTTLQFFAPGSTSLLDVLLFSNASTSGSGQSAQNFAQLTVAGTIPEPETLPLVLGGLVGACVIARKSVKRAG